ncbi:MAG: DUF1080 domain-containing protein [bacterium]|nr:DUF1080 domain-containing protein [bacterium]
MRILRVVVGLCWMLAPHILAGAEKADFLGRWDITIANTGDTFRSSWLEVTESEGKLGGKLLWKWGSVTDVKSVEVVGDELRVTRSESYEDKPVDVVYAAKLVEGKLVGSVKNPDGSVHNWTGIRALDKLDVSGTWEVTVETLRSPRKEILTLNQQGPNLSGEYVDVDAPPNWEFELREGVVSGSKVSLLVAYRRLTGGDNLMRYSAKVEGDKMTGTVQADGGARYGFTARRQRKWGEPVELFNGKDLTGFGPRDASRGFNWSVKDGVLVNRPPDQDIVSEKQFQDFKLHVEFSMARGSNSGIYLRGRYELQLEDDFGRQPGKHSSSSIYSRLAPSVNASKPADEWQTIDATLVGGWLTVVLNGQTVLDNVHLDGITGGALIPKGAEINDESLPGPLMFQGDHGLVRFRKIVATPSVD